MSDSLVLAPEVIECAIAAGYVVNSIDQASGGRVEFSSGLGETRLLVGTESDEMIVVNESDRLQDEYLVFAAPVVSTVERYLLMTFGSTIRFRRKLPRLRFPVDSDGVAAGFKLAPVPFRGDPRLALVSADDRTVAWGRSDPIIATVVLVELSHHMAGPLNDIAASYLNPSGSPLFDRYIENGAKG